MIPESILASGAAFIGLLAMVGFAARLYKPGFGRDLAIGNRSLVRLETVALDPRRRVHLMQCEGRRFILLTGGTQDLVVGWVADQ
jgi:hypothetical protein